MNEHKKLMKKVTGKRGGTSWKCVNTWTNGNVNIMHPGTYRITRVTSGFNKSGREFEVTRQEIADGNEYFDKGVLV